MVVTRPCLARSLVGWEVMNVFYRTHFRSVAKVSARGRIQTYVSKRRQLLKMKYTRMVPLDKLNHIRFTR